jgi:fatty acid-binding protein DegV
VEDRDRLGKLTKAYINIRARRTEIAAEFKKEDDGLKEQQDKIKATLLEFCKENNIDSVRTEAVCSTEARSAATGLAIGSRCTSYP